MNGPNLSLPLLSPDSVRLQEASFSLHPFALYTLVDITEDEYSRILENCNSRYDNHDNSVQRPPKYGFVGQSLQSAFDYHLQLERFDKVYFLAITSRNWTETGVYLVTMDNEQGHPDACSIPVDESGLTLVNLQIGNSDWPEVKKKWAN